MNSHAEGRKTSKKKTKELSKAAASPYQIEVTTLLKKTTTELVEPENSHGELQNQDKVGIGRQRKDNTEKQKSDAKDSEILTENLVRKVEDFSEIDKKTVTEMEELVLRLGLMSIGVAIRGDNDEEFNIYQFNFDKNKDDKALEMLMIENHYVLPHDILQKLEQLLPLEARRHIVELIKDKHFYSLLVDESSDIAKKEQISFNIRTSSDNYEVNEDFIGVYECVNGLSSDALVAYIENILLRCNLEYTKVAGISLDRVLVIKCLAANLKNILGQQAQYFHCMAHCSELIVKDTYAISSLLSDSFEHIQSVLPFSNKSSLMQYIKKYILHETESDEYRVLRLKSIPMTSWTTRTKAVQVVLEKIAELQNLSKQLQEINLTSDVAVFCNRNASQRFAELRSDKEFNRILKATKKILGNKQDNESETEITQR
ncbi:52 kDa repressor of the inhibitor of the protein kinase-like [Hydra vulgaris]|uniref:52 kDa repressor of the inhibitor of the protein kinase-like n=1 Tax=Hydra vulgaris TaxID=6087 RepID=A0ABM4BZC1_HYDVU